DPRTFNMDPAQLELAIQAVKKQDPSIHPIPRNLDRGRTTDDGRRIPKGIIPVDLFGLPADYDGINGVAEKYGLFVIEDGAQSFGAVYNGKKTGALTDVAATSFFPAKPLGCYGDGGAVLTDDDHLADIMRSIRIHGKGKEKYDNVRIGINGRLDTLQAAILLEKLKLFPDEIEARNRVAERYSAGLKDLVRVPYVPEGSTSVWAQYSVVVENRTVMQENLKKAEIPTAIYYPKPLHLQGAFLDLGYKPGDFPVSEEISQKIFSLPMHPYIQDKVVDIIAEVIKSTLSGENLS
ncbi:MAG: DegT/DnrJ/EryC1/StrS family aminotransferase, partial [Deltaproteobacteria bacterium]|nr:DegT/DnrJ/EryC1/StrS family aminotransferase [Deltaproteobacteria bacterium]